MECKLCLKQFEPPDQPSLDKPSDIQAMISDLFSQQVSVFPFYVFFKE